MTQRTTDKQRPAQTRAPWKALAGVGILLLAAAAGITQCQRLADGDAPEGPYFQVAEGPLTISVTESGTVKPSEQEVIKNEIEGRTTILYLIPEGTRVEKGDLLVELDASQLQDTKVDQEIRVQNADAAFIQSRENLAVVKNQAQSDIDKATLTLRFAGEDIEQYQEGEFPNALKENEAHITLAQEELQRSREKVKWSKVLFNEKYLAESELQADELAAKKAELDVELARDRLSLLKEFTYKRKMAELESEAKQAEMALERVERKAAADVVQAEADLRAKESEFKRQSDKLAKLTDQIAKARIVAPRAGLVVYATSARFSWRGNTEPLDEGQEVHEREELIHLPTASTFKAEVKIHESNLDKIRIGLPVRIIVDALPGQEFIGHVSSIAPLPDASSMFMNPDLKVYNTEIAIVDGGDVLRTGMSCRTEIIVEHYDSTLYIPVQAVTRVDGRPTVFVREGKTVTQKAIDIGFDNNRMVRVLGGLQPGQEVLLTPPMGVATPVNRINARPLAAELRPADAAGSRPADPGDDTRTPGPVLADKAPDTEEKTQGTMTPEEQPKRRERLESMSPEERETLRRRRAGERNREE